MKKLAVFFYGLIAYFTFLISILYTIGFLENLIVPKSIDSGKETTLIQATIVNILLLSLFALQHSVMARPAFKKWWARIISPVIERSTFVLISSLLLLFIYWKWQPITTIVWQVENKMLSIIITAIFYVGWLVVFLSTCMINHFDLFGLKQVYENLRNNQTQHQQTGLKLIFFYKIVRHPIMLGFIIAFWATPVMTLGHLLFSITTTIYIFIAVKFLEEKDLLKSLGKEYKEYQKKVPMIFPFLGKEK